LRGEAKLIDEGELATEAVPDRLLVKKLGKEFIVRVEDIEWLESSGNYVNLNIGNRIYPLRATLSTLVDQLEPRGFRRVHRSHAVNLDFVESISPLESGDATITLRNGKTLNLSRRYRTEFRQHLGV
jgi:DNA-binding LytR/AlgR family response regulator